MSNIIEEKKERRKNRRRYKLKQNNIRKLPRFSIFRSKKHISVQIINDQTGETLVSCSSNEKNYKNIKGYNIDGAKIIGREIGKRAMDKKIFDVVFDIGDYKYHGRVKTIIETALEAGLKKENKIGENK